MSAAYLQNIKEYEALRQNMSSVIKDYLKNTLFPLEERWETFKAASKSHILPEHSYIQDLKHLEDVSWYDDFYKDRYILVEWVDIVESIEDNGPIAYDGTTNKYFEHIDAIKEEILSAGYFGFTYDW